MKFPTYKNENQKIEEGFLLVAGVDEAGIGPLAGPVVAAAVILDPQTVSGERTSDKWWARVRDSKLIPEKERALLVNFVKENSLSWAVGIVEPKVIDELNILNAAHMAMQQAVEKLLPIPHFVFTDGKHQIRNLKITHQAVVDADADILSVACASIIAKVTRDQIMFELHEQFPQYGFAQHKGYPTKLHRQAIKDHGPCPVHRKSFTLLKTTNLRAISEAV